MYLLKNKVASLDTVLSAINQLRSKFMEQRQQKLSIHDEQDVYRGIRFSEHAIKTIHQNILSSKNRKLDQHRNAWFWRRWWNNVRWIASMVWNAIYFWRRYDKNPDRFNSSLSNDERVRQLVIDILDELDNAIHIDAGRSYSQNIERIVKWLDHFTTSQIDPTKKVPTHIALEAFITAVEIADYDRRLNVVKIDQNDTIWDWGDTKRNSYASLLGIAGYTTLSLTGIVFILSSLSATNALIPSAVLSVIINSLALISGVGLFSGALLVSGISLVPSLALGFVFALLWRLHSTTLKHRYLTILNEARSMKSYQTRSEPIEQVLYPREKKAAKLSRPTINVMSLDFALTISSHYIADQTNNDPNQLAQLHQYSHVDLLSLHAEYAEHVIEQQTFQSQLSLLARIKQWLSPPLPKRFQHLINPNAQASKIKTIAFSMLDQFNSIFKVDVTRSYNKNFSILTKNIDQFSQYQQEDGSKLSIDKQDLAQAYLMAIAIANHDRNQKVLTLNKPKHIIDWTDQRFLQKTKFLGVAGYTTIILVLLVATASILATMHAILPVALITPILKALASLSGAGTFSSILAFTGISIIPCWLLGLVFAGLWSFTNSSYNHKHNQLLQEARNYRDAAELFVFRAAAPRVSKQKLATHPSKLSAKNMRPHSAFKNPKQTPSSRRSLKQADEQRTKTKRTPAKETLEDILLSKDETIGTEASKLGQAEFAELPTSQATAAPMTQTSQSVVEQQPQAEPAETMGFSDSSLRKLPRTVASAKQNSAPVAHKFSTLPNSRTYIPIQSNSKRQFVGDVEAPSKPRAHSADDLSRLLLTQENNSIDFRSS